MAKTINAFQLNRLYNQIAAVYPRVNTPDEATMPTFLKAYQGCSERELQEALDDYLRKESKAPMPADLIKIVWAKRDAKNRLGAANRVLAGEDTYFCPYCKGSGYMHVVLPDDSYGGGYVPCVHTKGIASAELKTKGSFGITVKSWKWRGRLKWDAGRTAFIPVEVEAREPGGTLVTAEQMEAQLGDMSLPF